MKVLGDWITYILYSALWRLVRLLPENRAYSFFNFLAIRSYEKDGRRIKRLRENYRKARPTLPDSEIEILVKAGIKNSMRYWCDTFRISDWSERRVIESVTTENEDLLISGAKSGRGVIVALPHAGNWDHAGYYFTTKGIEVNTVAEHLNPERLFRKFLAHRERMGIRVLDLADSVTEELATKLSDGKLVALVADRDLSKSGISVKFFGASARMPAGPALLAYRTAADLIVAFVSYRAKGIHIKFSGPIEIRRNEKERDEVERVTQVLAEKFEADINEDLVSWHMLQRIFVTDSEVKS